MDNNWFTESGVLAQYIADFKTRPQQQEMAKQVQYALDNTAVTIVEAGTGVGKTFAYLLPIMSNGGKTIISTGSKTLQDQLFSKDLPVVKKALNSDAKLALLKGRENYLCLHRLELTIEKGKFSRKSSLTHLKKIEDWRQTTKYGELTELHTIPGNSEIWSQITSSSTNCLGSDCSIYDHCYLIKARKRAQKADIIVVNHHLFLANLALREGSIKELLPNVDTIVIDEAHQLPELATHFFSDTISSHQLSGVLRDIEVEIKTRKDPSSDVLNANEIMNKAILDFRLALGDPGIRQPWYVVQYQPQVIRGIKQLLHSTEELINHLKELKKTSKGLDTSLKRLKTQKQLLETINQPQKNHIQWFETFTRSFALTNTPLDIANKFYQQMTRLKCAWVMTSATLTMQNSFQPFMFQLGIPVAYQKKLDSPFNFLKNTLLYAPPNMPMPHEVDFIDRVVEEAIPVINACGGRTFMLFTSYKALNNAAEQLQDEIDYPILVQGTYPQNEMIRRFRQLGNAVLLGTNSFWEGVDVRGSALSCVIIEKFPFASPRDPVLEAKIQAIREAGHNPFFEYQLPQAVLALKQGIGRLIRNENEKGLFMICDPRLRTKSYGHTFINSLPDMSKTEKLETVQRFLKLC